jgi:hypothetical protein
MDIYGWFYGTSELAIYTILLLSDGSSKHGEKWSLTYFGTMGSDVCHTNKKIRWGGATDE